MDVRLRGGRPLPPATNASSTRFLFIRAITSSIGPTRGRFRTAHPRLGGRKAKPCDGRSRFEENREEHHHHLIDLQSGEVIEFMNEEIEKLKEKIARDLGYQLIGHRLELYGVPMSRTTKPAGDK